MSAALTPAQRAARTRQERSDARATAERELATPEGQAKNERLIAELTQRAPLTIRKTIAEHLGDDCWLAMDENGDITEHPSSERLVRSLRRRDAEAAKRGESTATLIEWVDVPVGFVPPEVSS